MCPFRSKKVSGSELDLTNLTMTKICSLANRIDNELRKDDHMNTEEEVVCFYIFTRSRTINIIHNAVQNVRARKEQLPDNILNDIER